jgi:NADH:ubiquinone oxidoreductase subunit 4 (subunit M)
MLGRVALWVALAVLAIFFFAMASRAGRDVLDDQQLPRRDKQTEYFMCTLWVALGAAVGVFLFIDAFFFFHPAPPSLNGVPTRSS